MSAADRQAMIDTEAKLIAIEEKYRIERELIAQLVGTCVDAETAQIIIGEINAGSIPLLSINY